MLLFHFVIAVMWLTHLGMDTNKLVLLPLIPARVRVVFFGGIINLLQNGGKSLITWCCVEAGCSVRPPNGILLLSTAIWTNLSIGCRSSALPLPSIRVLHPNWQGKFSFTGTRPTATSHGSHVFSAVPISTPIPITSKAAPEHHSR